MLNAIQTKVLLAILAAAVAIGGYLVHERHVNERTAAAAAQAAALLQQQRDADDAAKKQDAETWKFVHDQRQKNNLNPANGSKTWTHYLP